jgi:ABC-type transport system involved in cytochrome c biogenesis permease component
MNASLQQLRISLKLHYRNKMALIYSYLFPLIFLLVFWVLYRHESIPLVRHMGELLTVSVLGGACFGLPTTMVSERERGVWRRYRLTPVSTAALVASTVAARYGILLTAGLLQLGVAVAIGMPLPKHPFDLLIVFTFVSFAFIGLGLVMAMMADNVPAVQALGQCIFLPMLVIGGIAVPLASLPEWAQHVSAFFPGRYAVEAFQACVIGNGLGAARFDLLALLIIGAGGCVAGAKMFRWDAQQRFAARSGKGWVTVALLSWCVVGVMSEYRGRTLATRSAGSAGSARQAQTSPESTPALPSASAPPGSVAAPAAPPPAPVTLSKAERNAVQTDAAPQPAPTTPAPALPQQAPQAKMPPPNPTQTSWEAVTMADIDRDLVFDRLPSDGGIVTPIAPVDEEPDADTADHLQYIREMLPSWQSGKVADPVQRVRNILYVAAVPDVLQMPIERFTTYAVYERLQQDIPKDQLIKILYWIALHPTDGDDKAVDELWALRFPDGAVDVQQTRERAAIYAVKLLGRLVGKLPRSPS